MSQLILSFVVLRAMQNPNTPCGQNVKIFNVKTGGTQTNHWAVKGKRIISLQRSVIPNRILQ